MATSPAGQQPLDDSLETLGDSISGMRLQLFSLGLLRSTEAIAWTSIFPYVYFMIRSFKSVEETQITLYAGLLIAVYTFCEFLSGMIWASVSDKIGRKRTLLIGSTCGIITALWFGLSRSLWQAVASRAFGGLLNPNVGLVQTCVVELVQRKEQRAKALSFVTFFRSIGNLIGPVLGGILADPGALYPSLFPPNSVWTTYPFFLPNLVVASLQAISWIVAFLFLAETHPQLADQPNPGLRIGRILVSYLKGKPTTQGTYGYAPLPGDQAGRGNGGSVEAGPVEQQFHELADMSVEAQHEDSQPGFRPKKAFTQQVILQLISVSMLAFHKVSSDSIMPTFLAAPPTPPNSQRTPARNFLESTSGFGYSSQKIGIILLSQAIVAVITQATVVPLFIDRVGPLKAYRIVLSIYPTMYLFTPLLPKLGSPFPLILVALDLWIKVIISSVGYICSAILIANTTPAARFLARINGASASFSCLSRSVGPIITGKLFAVGLNVGYVGIAFWTLSVVALLGMFESAFLRDHL